MGRFGGDAATVQYKRFYIQSEYNKYRLVILDGFEDDPCMMVNDSFHGASFGRQGYLLLSWSEVVVIDDTH